MDGIYFNHRLAGLITTQPHSEKTVHFHNPPLLSSAMQGCLCTRVETAALCYVLPTEKDTYRAQRTYTSKRNTKYDSLQVSYDTAHNVYQPAMKA
jgi:hypothetical protein